jgi:hemolysin activation/secretion protein
MTLPDIRERVRDVTQDYLSRGFITSRAWLPEQDISGGTLVIAVTEGKVEAVTLEGHEENAIRMAFPRTEGRVLNLRDAEQGLEQLNRLNSRPLTVDILPGSREGFSRVTLVPVSQRFPVSLDVGADNSGQKSTGSGQLNARLTADNPLSLADQWTLAAGRDSEFHHDRRSRNIQAGVSVPYGYWLFSAQYAWSDFIRRFLLVEPRSAGAMKAPCSHSGWPPAGRYCVTVSNVWRWMSPYPAGKPKTGWAAYVLTSAARRSAA